jgi:hypothetical protein
MRADPSPRYAHLTPEQRQAQLDALALELMTTCVPDRRRMLWREMADLRQAAPRGAWVDA